MYLAVLHHSKPQWLYDLYGHILAVVKGAKYCVTVELEW